MEAEALAFFNLQRNQGYWLVLLASAVMLTV